MKQFFNVSLAFALTAWLVGCAPSRPLRIKASPLPDQISRYDQGRQIFISRGHHSSVGLSLSTETVQPRNPVDFHVAVANYSSNPFNFSTDNIYAKCDRKTIYVYHPEEALRDQEKRTDFDAADLAGLSPADIQALSPQMKKYYQLRNQKLRDFAQSLLRAQTIMPESTHEGTVRMAFPSCTDKLELIITTGDDVHKFVFDTIAK
jgi:hypothetical protein